MIKLFWLTFSFFAFSTYCFVSPELLGFGTGYLSSGWQHSQTGQNLISTSEKEELTFNNTQSLLVEDGFNLKISYSMFEQWYARAESSLLFRKMRAFGTEEILAEGNGLEFFDFGVGYSFDSGPVRWTMEANMLLPANTDHAFSQNVLAVSEDVYEPSFYFKMNYRDQFFLASLSPGIFVTFPEGTSGLKIASKLGYQIGMVHLLLKTHSRVSFKESLGEDRNGFTHNTLGAGNSYAIRSISPSYFDLIGQIDFAITNTLTVSAFYSKRLFGVRTSDVSVLGLELTIQAKVQEKDQREKLIEQPLKNDLSESIL